MKIHRFVLAAAITLALSACSAHSPMIMTNTTDSTTPEKVFPPGTEKIFLIPGPMPKGIEYDRISKIDFGKAWYGGAADAQKAMADRARELGANAIIEASTWTQPSGFSWAAPHGSGVAVRVKDMKQLQAAGIKGEWH